jgi:hypothetical protein
MAASSWTALALNTANTSLIRKTLAGGVAFIAPYSSAAVTSLTAADAGSVIQALPTGYKNLGLLSEDGATFPRNIDTSDVRSWGYSEPTRTDTTKDESSCKIVCQETNLNTLSLYLGTSLTALTADATTSEVIYDKPATPPTTYFRLLVIGRDVYQGLDVYLGRYFPKAQITDRDDLQMGVGDDPVQYGLTFSAKYDSALSTAERYFWAGPGWASLKTAMGFS